MAGSDPRLLRSPRCLLIVSHVPHFAWAGRLWAYGPYAREVDVWAELFPEVRVAAPLRPEAPPGDALPFARPNVSVRPQLETGGDTGTAKLGQLLNLPRHLWRLGREMRWAEAIHVRCPGNLGLLGCLMAPCFRTPRAAKYAGQWDDYPEEPRFWRLQKRVLASAWWRAPVFVYGAWPGQAAHIVSSFASVLDQAAMDRAQAATHDWSQRPLELLFVGRLSREKNVDAVLWAVARLGAAGCATRLRIVGEGPMRQSLEALSASLGLTVKFEGAVPPSRVLHYYEQSHLLVLVSRTEGWPKVVAEAMAFGLVCFGSNRGILPQMLGEGRGVVVEPGDADALAAAIERVAREPAEAARMSARAAAWSRQFTLEGVREALRGHLETAWGVKLGASAVEAGKQ